MIVGLTGYARCGKDTAAAALVADGWQRIAFADKLKEVAYRSDPALAELVDSLGWEGAKEFRDVREYLQRLGAACREVIGDWCWVDAALRGFASYGDVVVTDVRYGNEAAEILGTGGLVLRIDRPGVGPVNDHASEAGEAFAHASAVIVNDGTPEQLAEKIRAAVR